MDRQWLRRLMHLFWRFSRGQTVSVRVVALDDAGNVFLVRSGSGGWRVPETALSPGHSALDAVAAALAGCGLASGSRPMLSALHRDVAESNVDHMAVYVVRSAARAPANDTETGRFFPPDALPDETHPSTRKLVAGIAPPTS